MDADDVPPSRLGAARHTLHDLVQRRAGARTALIAYAGSAHLVLPATDDPALLDSFIQALASDLIAKPGKDVLGVVNIALRLLDAEHSPGTLVLLTDGADPAQFEASASAWATATCRCWCWQWAARTAGCCTMPRACRASMPWAMPCRVVSTSRACKAWPRPPMRRWAA
jgi:Mg-chelatase subunit ChlD